MGFSMRKFLITTALTCFAFSAMAEVSVKLHGKYEFQAGTRSQKSTYIDQMYPIGAPINSAQTTFRPGFGNQTKNQKNAQFYSKARVGVLVEGKTDHGLKYGANVMLSPRTTDTSKWEGKGEEKSYLFAEHHFGKVELGSNYAVDSMMNIGAESIACATGGASNGDWNLYFKSNGNDSTGNTSGLSMNPITSGVSYMYRTLDNRYQEGPRKVSYMTPMYDGFRLGASYTPDPNNIGYNGVTNPNIGDFVSAKNIVSLAGTYEKQVSGLDFALSASYNFSGVANSANVNKLSEYAVGVKIGKGAFAVAGSYGDAGKSLRAKGLAYKPKQNYYTAGISYSMDKFGASLTYLGSRNTEENYSGYSGISGTAPTLSDSNPTGSITKLNAYSLGVDYMVASGLKTYAEVTFVSVSNPAVQNSLSNITYAAGNANKNPAAPKNNGTVIIAGAVVRF